MRIGVQAQFQIFVPLDRAPNLGEAEKKSLLRSEAVDFLVRFSGQRFL